MDIILSVFDACAVDANVEHILRWVAGEARAKDGVNDASVLVPSKASSCWVSKPKRTRSLE